MNEDVKQAYLDKAVAQLKEWSSKVEVVKAKIDMSKADVRIDFHKQMESWEKKQAELSQKMTEMRAAGADDFEKLKSGVQAVWNDIGSLVKSLDGKKNEIN